jgi:hypothetical protein
VAVSGDVDLALHPDAAARFDADDAGGAVEDDGEFPVESATSQASTLIPVGWLDRISAARSRPWTVARPGSRGDPIGSVPAGRRPAKG